MVRATALRVRADSLGNGALCAVRALWVETVSVANRALGTKPVSVLVLLRASRARRGEWSGDKPPEEGTIDRWDVLPRRQGIALGTAE